MARIHKKEVYHFANHLRQAKTFGEFLQTLNKFGAQELGEGASRKVWKWGNYVVKISAWDYDDNPEESMVECIENKSEVKTYLKANRHLKKMMAKPYPEISPSDGRFIFMEFVPKGEFWYKEIEMYQARAGKISKRKRSDLPYCIVHDAHDGNFCKRDNGQLVMIDLQEDW